MSIMLFTPVRQDPETLALVLQAHSAMSGIAHRVYVDDNENPASSEMLAALTGAVTVIQPNSELGKSSYAGHQWNPTTITRLAAIRNLGLMLFDESDCDWMLSVDSDVVVNPDMAMRMAALNESRESIITQVYWSKWDPTSPWLPQVWDYHPYQFDSAQRVLRLREVGTYRVGAGGACTLIPRSAPRYLNYSDIPSLSRICWGEDRWFCTRAEVAGVPHFADTHFPPFHVYRSAQLEEAKAWYADGAHPGYFRKHWLVNDWEPSIRRMLA